MTTQYAYLIDPRNPLRRLTIARRVEDGEICFGTAVNKCYDAKIVKRKPISAVFKHSNNDLNRNHVAVYPHMAVDVFKKKLGRAIAEKAIDRRGYVIPQEDGVAPHISILKYLANNVGVNEIVSRIAKHHLLGGRGLGGGKLAMAAE